ncbi:uncharacterized protein N7458_001014 [Penicillium daleae]|uniref:BTB domain-containing protein n=1 Tax=Penicillium daleae TaxID=63821 RepID=A0AAD6G7Z6_9EURO|nr:uncharacterized protein N7458_001014 [Penicillium daleae]KAJ5465328.1 hypothetical protein N7458_001014 [Penicillium daleae]
MGFSDLEVVMRSFLDDGKYADMTISCQEHNFKGHRAIICSQSPFFDAALNDGFKEAKSSQVNLPGDNVDTIARVLSFCYLQDYGQVDDSMNLKPDGIPRSHRGVYLAADKFGIFSLRELASSRIVNWAKSNWNLGCFPHIVEDIWCTTPPHENGLRDAIVEVVSTNIQHFLTQNEGNNVFNDNPAFTVAVLKRVASLHPLQRS